MTDKDKFSVRIVSSKYLFEGKAVKLRIDTVELPDGRQTTREVVEHADCIAAIPVDAEGNVILVRQFREGIKQVLLEIPAGGIDDGETPEDAVRRELQEEIGLYPHHVERIGGFFSTPGYCKEYLHIYLAADLERKKLTAEDTDYIEVVRVPMPDIPELIASGEICDAKSIAALLMVPLLKTQ
jgi:ADP-ribose pyrophosphatase